MNTYLISIISLLIFSNGALGKGAAPKPSPPMVNVGNCIVGYEHGNFRGRAYNFCLHQKAPAFKDWNDKISSVKIPMGMKAQFCKHVGHDSNGSPVGVGPCVFYFQDVPYVGDFMNDSFSYIRYGKFHGSSFSMIISSDPQLPWSCRAPECKIINNEKEEGRLSNAWQVESIKTTANQIPFEKFAGLIINGDLTAYGHGWQYEMYRDFYENKMPLHVWPGLGNHDYGVNNVNKSWNNNCAARMMYYLADRVRSLNVQSFDYNESGTYYKFPIFRKNYSGSYAYSFDIGNYHFIQLNNYPAYETNFSTWNYGKARKDYFNIYKANEWIKKDLEKNKDKFIILNMHNVGGGDGFYPNERTEFYGLFTGYKVAAIFGGHFHGSNHFFKNEKIAGKNVPVFLSGSSEYSTYLVVDFFNDRLEVKTIDSTGGKNNKIKGPYVVPLTGSGLQPGFPNYPSFSP